VDQLLVLIVMGVSGSGKSTVAKTLAERLGLVYLEGDDFHSPENIEKMEAGIPLTDEDRWPWIAAMNAHIKQELKEGRGVILAASVLKKIYRTTLTDDLPQARFIYLKGSKALLLARMKARTGHFMPPALLESQLETLEEPQADEHALTVSIEAPPDEVIEEIIRGLETTTHTEMP
jgi:carbohydrate kinase (thermoresistant glucokinase family)